MRFIDCGLKAYPFIADGYYLLNNRQPTISILRALMIFLKRFHKPRWLCLLIHNDYQVNSPDGLLKKHIRSSRCMRNEPFW